MKERAFYGFISVFIPKVYVCMLSYIMQCDAVQCSSIQLKTLDNGMSRGRKGALLLASRKQRCFPGQQIRMNEIHPRLKRKEKKKMRCSVAQGKPRLGRLCIRAARRVVVRLLSDLTCNQSSSLPRLYAPLIDQLNALSKYLANLFLSRTTDISDQPQRHSPHTH